MRALFGSYFSLQWNLNTCLRVKFEGVGQNTRYRKTEVEILQNVHNQTQSFCQILRTFTIDE